MTRWQKASVIPLLAKQSLLATDDRVGAGGQGVERKPRKASSPALSPGTKSLLRDRPCSNERGSKEEGPLGLLSPGRLER